MTDKAPQSSNHQVERFEIWSVSHDGLAEIAHKRPGMEPTDMEQYVPNVDTDVFVRASDFERLTRERDSAREALRVSEQRVREHWPERERLRAALTGLRARIAALDPYTAAGATGTGLTFADVATEHVKAFQDRILDIIDESSAPETGDESMTGEHPKAEVMTSNHQVHLSAIEAIAERLVRDRHEKGYAATPEADTLRLVIAELKDLRQEMGAPTLLSASARCPLCGQEGPHPHTPLEQAIYRNGLKAGSLHAETPLERAFAEEPQRTIVNDALLKIGAGDETAAPPAADWRCRKCGFTNSAARSTCWNCDK